LRLRLVGVAAAVAVVLSGLFGVPAAGSGERQGPSSGEFKAWTKGLDNGSQNKFYAKYPQPGQKVQFLYQNASGAYVEFAWLRVDERFLNDDGSYRNLQNEIYFIRTFHLGPGKNRLRVAVDGQIVWGTKTYTIKPPKPGTHGAAPEADDAEVVEEATEAARPPVFFGGGRW